MVCPTMANAAPPKFANPYELSDADWDGLVMNDIHTQPFNFSGSPTLSVPCGFPAEGLPLGVQFVGRRLSEAVLCRVGHAFERITEWHLRGPAV
jgi:Asp-tRNA(Asn)/Glu-tRNA(Gln) amidotransferase A subunit family amidase